MMSFLLTALAVGALVLLFVVLALRSAFKNAKPGEPVEAASEYHEPQNLYHDTGAIDEFVPRDSSGRPYIPM